MPKNPSYRKIEVDFRTFSPASPVKKKESNSTFLIEKLILENSSLRILCISFHTQQECKLKISTYLGRKLN